MASTYARVAGEIGGNASSPQTSTRSAFKRSALRRSSPNRFHTAPTAGDGFASRPVSIAS